MRALTIRHTVTAAKVRATIFAGLTMVEGLKSAVRTFEKDITELPCFTGYAAVGRSSDFGGGESSAYNHNCDYSREHHRIRGQAIESLAGDRPEHERIIPTGHEQRA